MTSCIRSFYLGFLYICQFQILRSYTDSFSLCYDVDIQTSVSDPFHFRLSDPGPALHCFVHLLKTGYLHSFQSQYVYCFNDYSNYVNVFHLYLLVYQIDIIFNRKIFSHEVP